MTAATSTGDRDKLINNQAALILRLLIELDLAGAATDFTTPALIASEAREIDRSEAAEDRLIRTKGITAGLAIGSAAVAAITPLIITVASNLILYPSTPWDFVTTAHVSGSAGAAAAVFGVAFAVVKGRLDRQVLFTSGVVAKKDARHPSAVYAEALDRATEEVATVLRVTAISGHPEIPLMAYLKAATQLSTRALIGRSLLCQLNLDPYTGLLTLGNDSTTRAN